MSRFFGTVLERMQIYSMDLPMGRIAAALKAMVALAQPFDGTNMFQGSETSGITYRCAAQAFRLPTGDDLIATRCVILVESHQGNPINASIC